MDGTVLWGLLQEPSADLVEHVGGSLLCEGFWLYANPTVWLWWKLSLQTLYVWWLGLDSSSIYSLWFLAKFLTDICNVQDKISAEIPDAEGAVFVLVIIGSDKTTVSIATGQVKYWPLYASVGNLHNNVHRAHGSRLVLIGFLAIPKSKTTIIPLPAQEHVC